MSRKRTKKKNGKMFIFTSVPTLLFDDSVKSKARLMPKNVTQRFIDFSSQTRETPESSFESSFMFRCVSVFGFFDCVSDDNTLWYLLDIWEFRESFSVFQVPLAGHEERLKFVIDKTFIRHPYFLLCSLHFSIRSDRKS